MRLLPEPMPGGLDRLFFFIEAGMAERKALSKKTRFEVFKRDLFKCQYCGRSSPEVILHVDHIQPVAEGGGNNILNLITSCQDCNAGKGARLIGDNAAIEKQKKALEEMAERRDQLSMMLKWRNEMKNLEDSEIDMVETQIKDCINQDWALTEYGRRNAKGIIRKYGLLEVLTAIDIASNNSSLRISGLFPYLYGICRNRSIRSSEDK